MSHSPSLRLALDGYPRGGLHGQIVHDIGRQILSGEIQPGDVVVIRNEGPAGGPGCKLAA